MRIPRDISGIELAKKLERYGYDITRQTGSHMRLTTDEGVNIMSQSQTIKIYE